MKRIISVILVAVLTAMLFAATAFAAEKATVKTKYSNGTLHLRAGEGTQYASKGYVKNGQEIEVISEGSVWSKIRVVDSGKTGYIKTSYIRYEETEDFVRGKTVYVSEKGGSLKVRAGMGTNYAVNGYVEHGDTITVLNSGETWSMIRVEKSGVMGFIKSMYIYGHGTPGWSGSIEESVQVTTYEAATVVTKYASSKVNIRASASSSSARVGQVGRGTYLKVTGSSGNWYQVTTLSGISGYISKSYVVMGAAGKTTTALNVRKGPGSSYSKLTTLTKGTSVTILSVDGNWAKIRYGKSATGYVSIRYLNY